MSKKQLLRLLTQFEDLIDGALDTHNGRKCNIELREGAEPFHAKRPYTVPRAHECQFRTEVKQLCELGVLKKINSPNGLLVLEAHDLVHL
jgi:hypothetical protein